MEILSNEVLSVTRGITSKQFTESNKGLKENGPNWLADSAKWPENKITSKTVMTTLIQSNEMDQNEADEEQAPNVGNIINIQKYGNEQTIQKGDIVQIHDERPCTNGKLGLVKELVRGKDGLVRSVRIKTRTGETTRPIVKLYPLEISTDDTTANTSSAGEGCTRCDTELRMRRKASLKAS
jgi:hypothetical protein